MVVAVVVDVERVGTRVNECGFGGCCCCGFGCGWGLWWSETAKKEEDVLFPWVA